MECHYSVNQLISETLISVFMEQTDCQETPGIHPPLIMVKNTETASSPPSVEACPLPQAPSLPSHQSPTSTPPSPSKLTKTDIGRHNSTSHFSDTFQ